MAEVVFFQALSEDGFVTDANGSAAWQGPYFIPELGFHDFIAGVTAVITARASYDKIAASGTWPYGPVPGIVPSETPLTDIGAPVTAVADDPAAIVAAARGKGDGTVWVQGDTDLAFRLIHAGLVDRLDLFVMPVTLGHGTEHIDRHHLPGFTLATSTNFANGVTRLVYVRG
ncbi:dihydrofolate reductase family protein [Devosia ginsengisoli]|uniref:dihydrofolate reductase family protein n=1 Tax=Devosia ginsengisoli TaxID=400770 RepID=UPI0026F2A7C9|nr:dihydrofolate reductase family protein [Devosia ginsengisoli]MCR6670015.1 dihydrofolate reductase family protein [Devosia ginsengisoli]